jgi:hypothetical protein
MLNRQRWQFHEKTWTAKNRWRAIRKKEKSCKKHYEAPLAAYLGQETKEERRKKEKIGRIEKEEGRRGKEKEERGGGKASWWERKRGIKV